MCIGIIWNNFFFSRQMRLGRGSIRASAQARLPTAHGAQVVWPLDYMGRSASPIANVITKKQHHHELELSHAATWLLQHAVRRRLTLGTGAAEVASEFAVDVGVRRDAVTVNVQFLVIHQPTLLSEYDRLHVGQIRQRVNQFQLRYLQDDRASA